MRPATKEDKELWYKLSEEVRALIHNKYKKLLETLPNDEVASLDDESIDVVLSCIYDSVIEE